MWYDTLYEVLTIINNIILCLIGIHYTLSYRDTIFFTSGLYDFVLGKKESLSKKFYKA